MRSELNNTANHFCGLETPARYLSLGQLFVLVHTGATDPERGHLVEVIAGLFADHGLDAPSTVAARIATSCGAPTVQALIAGLACFGSSHAPIEAAARVFLGVDDWREMHRVPGYGHPIYDIDPRVEIIFSEADKIKGVEWRCVGKAHEIEVSLPVTLNYAGAAAAVLADLGIDPKAMPAVPLMGRLIGLSAHIVEQSRQSEKLLTH